MNKELKCPQLYVKFGRQGSANLVWYENFIDYRDNNRYSIYKIDAQKKNFR